ncbi:MAG: response regulator [Methanothrix sp.]|jgi:CheY-like chemotaxis protein|nr:MULTISPECIES: response regulator [Methanothrix]MBC7079702.1 response regulator [Methanothrix sp.]NPU87777.1 response regulator [Methanothrix sp.]
MGEDTRKLRILLVEDNPEDVFLTRKVLRKSGLDGDMQITGDGAEALRILEDMLRAGEHLPDLILLDINLPDMGGMAVLKSIKGDARFSRIPVVMLTCSNADSDIQKSYDLGASTYLVKPVSRDAMILVMRALFG